MSVDRTNWKPLSPLLKAAVKEFSDWSLEHLSHSDTNNRVDFPLYHYTDATGLDGIIKNQQIWFTRYTHLNDPTELEYGMSIASDLLIEIGKNSDLRIKFFCDMINDLFTHKQFRNAFDVFVASFSRDKDDLGQWRGYGDNGRGFSLGLAPRLFHIEDVANRQPHEKVFVVPMVYGKESGRKHHMPAIKKAISVVKKIVYREPDLMQDKSIGMPFLDEMAKSLIASELLLNSLTIKHAAYQNEKEVRLFIIGQNKDLAPYVSTRPRRGDIVPFIKSNMEIQSNGGIVEIIVGPSASNNADDGVKSLLRPFHETPDSIVHRSTIPYRAF